MTFVCVYSAVCVKEAGQHMSGAARLLLLHPFTESWLHQRRHGCPEADGWFHYKITAENYQRLSITAVEKPAHTHSVLFHFVNFFFLFFLTIIIKTHCHSLFIHVLSVIVSSRCHNKVKTCLCCQCKSVSSATNI